VGGQFDPSSIVGDNLVWKNAQKHNTSDTINKFIPHHHEVVPKYPRCHYMLLM
jgi:hypothetical protein